ncbi:MAG: 50S ribosomal protein L9 [Patescibacteria group bacterium]
MKILLIKHLESLGRRGEIKNVAEGYARNFLLPGKFAVVANEANVKKYANIENQVESKQVNKKLKTPEEIAARLRTLSIVLTEKADEGGTLFAGITKEKLVQLLAAKGIDLKTKQIDLAEPIKKIGDYKIGVNISASFKSEFRVSIKKN